MSQPKDGGPAFPGKREVQNGVTGHSREVPTAGMSLRDYFAAQAIGAIIIATSAGQHKPRGDGNVREFIARDAWAIADHMLAERARAT